MLFFGGVLLLFAPCWLALECQDYLLVEFSLAWFPRLFIKTECSVLLLPCCWTVHFRIQRQIEKVYATEPVLTCPPHQRCSQSQFVGSVQLRICILGLEISVLCPHKASPKLQYLLEDVLQSTVKSVRYYLHLKGYLTQLQGPVSVPPKSNTRTPHFGTLVVLPSEVELAFDKVKLSGLYQTVVRSPCIH